MPQAILRYHKGINQDIDKNTLTDGNYFTLENGRVISDKQLSQGSVTTIRGNVKIIDIPDGHRIKAQWQFATSSSVPTLSITALGVTTVFTSSALTPELKANDLVTQINTSGKPYKAFFIEATSVFYITPLVHTTTISITSSGVSEFALDSSDYFNINGTKTLGDYLTIVDGWTTQVPMVRGYGIQGDRLILFCQVTIGDVDNLAIYSINFGGISIDVKLAYFCSNWKFGTIMNESIVHYESDNVFTIYWLNVIDEAPSPIYTLNLNADDSYFTPKSMLNIVPDVRLCEPMLTDIQLGGKLKVGKIQYSYSLYKKYGQESNYSPFSGLFHLTDKSDKGDYQNYCGAPRYEDGTTTSRSANKSVKINIGDIDQNYTHIKVVSIWYDTLNGAPACNIIADQKIVGTSMDFIDTGDSLGDISIETILTKKTRIRCKTITEKNNILFAGNVEEESTYIQALEDYDTRAYRFGANSAQGTSYAYNRIAVLNTNLKPSDTAGDYVIGDTEYTSGVYDTTKTSAYWDSDLGDTKYIHGIYNPEGIKSEPPNGRIVLDASDGLGTWKTEINGNTNIAAKDIPKEHNCVNRFNDVSDYSANSENVPAIYDFMYQSDGTTLGGEGINIKYSFNTNPMTIDSSYLSSLCYDGVLGRPDVRDETMKLVTIDNEDYDCFASPLNSAYELSLQPDEIYAIGISWKLKDGTDYPVKWVGDIRTPRYLEHRLASTDVDESKCYAFNLYCTFSVLITSDMLEYVQGYEIVSCKRDSDNRTVRSIGLLNQLDRNTNDTAPVANHDIYDAIYDFINLRYVDAIRHKKFTVGIQPSRVQGFDDSYSEDGQRNNTFYEYISPEVAFNSDYDVLEGIDKIVPIQMFLTGTYWNGEIDNGTCSLNKNAVGWGSELHLMQHAGGVSGGGSIRILEASQKVLQTHDLGEMSALITRPSNDLDYRNGFDIKGSYKLDPAESASFRYKHDTTRFNRSYMNGFYDKSGSIGSSLIHELSGNLTGLILDIDAWTRFVPSPLPGGDSEYDYDVLIGNKYYNKVSGSASGADSRNGFGLYVMHRRMFYPFFGCTFAGRTNRTYYKSSNYKPVSTASLVSVNMIGDTFTSQYQHVRYLTDDKFQLDPAHAYTSGEEYSKAKCSTGIITFPVHTSINTDLRHDTDIPRYSNMFNLRYSAGLHAGCEMRTGFYNYFYNSEHVLFDEYQQKRDINLYNTVYSLVRGWDVYLPLPYNTSDTTKFPTRMLASNNKINDELIDSWTQVSVFKDKDLEVKYGEIVDLIVWKDRLFAIQEAGIATVAVNERSAVSDASGETLSIAGANVFSYHQYSSTYTGTKFKYKFSIVSAPEVLYLYDSNRSVMAYLSQSDENASLSDVKGLYSWFDLNLQPENITYIQSVYDTNYNEILTSIECGSTVTTIVFSEKMLTYEMFLKHVRGVINIGTPARLLSWQMNAMAKSVVWQHNIGKENMLWGTYYPLNLSAVFTSRGKMERYHGLINSIMLLDNVEFIADVSNMDGHTIETKYIDNESITSIRAYNSYQDTGVMSLVDSNKKLISRLIMRFARKWRMNKFWDILRPNKYRPDVTIRDSYVQVDMQFNGKLYDETAITNRSLQLSDVTVNYRELNQTQY